MGTIKKIVALHNKKEDPKWDNWKEKACLDILYQYKEEGWIGDIKDLKESFVELEKKLLGFFFNKEILVKRMINKDLDFKVFLYLHSCFHVYHDTDDWLVKIIRDNISLSKEEVEEYSKKREVPEDIMNKFSMFNPEVIPYDFHPVAITYGFWQRDEDGRVCDPIRVIDRSKLGIKGVKKYYSAKSFINKYEDIDMKIWEPEEGQMTWEMYKEIYDV